MMQKSKSLSVIKHKNDTKINVMTNTNSNYVSAHILDTFNNDLLYNICIYGSYQSHGKIFFYIENKLSKKIIHIKDLCNNQIQDNKLKKFILNYNFSVNESGIHCCGLLLIGSRIDNNILINKLDIMQINKNTNKMSINEIKHHDLDKIIKKMIYSIDISTILNITTNAKQNISKQINKPNDNMNQIISTQNSTNGIKIKDINTRFIKNQNVIISKHNGNIKVTVNQSNSTPGIYIVKQLYDKCQYNIKITGTNYSKIGNIRLYIYNYDTGETLEFSDKYKLGNRKSTIDYCLQKAGKYKIGLLWFNAEMGDYFVMNIFDIAKNKTMNSVIRPINNIEFIKPIIKSIHNVQIIDMNYELDLLNNINFEYNFDYNDTINFDNYEITDDIILMRRMVGDYNICVNNKLINSLIKTNEIQISFVKGDRAITRPNIPGQKISFIAPYDNNCDGLFYYSKSWFDQIKNKTSLLYPHVYDDDLYDTLNKKQHIILNQYIDKQWYNWMSDDEISNLKLKYFPQNSFISCISNNVTINTYPLSLIHAIKKLRDNGIDAYLLIVGDLESINYLPEYEKNELDSYFWIKKISVFRKNILNYYRICDVLASTTRDYSNVICSNMKIMEYLLCDKPILCSYGYERETELGKNYSGFYNCSLCFSVPPLYFTQEYQNNSKIIEHYYEKYYAQLDKTPCNSEINDIYNYVFNIAVMNLHNLNKNNNKILIYQESLAIRCWKIGLELYKRGYDIEYCYHKYDFGFNYVHMYVNFIDNIHKMNNSDDDYILFIELMGKFDDIIFINAWENYAIKSLKYDPIYYIGDLQIARYKSIRNGINNISAKNERKILTSSNRIIFTNKYMPIILKNKPIEIDNIHYSVLENSIITDSKFKPNVRDYTNKNFFNLVYIGSLETIKPTHRNIVDDIIKLSNNKYIKIDIYPTAHNIDNIKNVFLNNKNIIVKNTLSQDEIIPILNKYDYGVCMFNLSYNDSEYIELSQPNKFYDYYFSNLPIICNNTYAFNDFVVNNKIGMCIDTIDEINLQKLQQIYFHDSKKINTYSELVTTIMNKISKNKIFTHLYVSDALRFFEKRMELKFNLFKYCSQLYVGCIFFGCYYEQDFNNIINHKGKKLLLLGGSDTTYEYFNKKIGELINNDIQILCQSKIIYNNMIEKYPKKLLLFHPITPVIIDDFYDPHNIKGTDIYIYTSQTTPEIYGIHIYTQIIKKLNHKYNFIIATANTSSNIKELYKKCFIGLRLTKFDGLGATNIELGLMGIKVVTNNISPNCLHWNNINDIINHIENESLNINKSDEHMSNNVYKFINQENNIFY
jgi:hypothetical protein